MRVAACCKHFDVHGGPEDIPVSRMNFNAKVKATFGAAADSKMHGLGLDA